MRFIIYAITLTSIVGCCRFPAGPVPPVIIKTPPVGVYEILRVVDGDTLEIGIELATGELLRQSVRLVDVDAPERGKRGLDRAKADLTRLALGRGKVGLCSQ